MKSIHKSALVSYSASKMFALVDNIGDYAEFLPWCGSSAEISRTPEEVQGCIEISHKGVNKKFTTRNIVTTNELIEMQLVDGPFKSLNGYWKFEPLKDNACKISLDLNYEFSNKLLAMLIGPVFNQIANSMVDAFCERADACYGKSG